MSKTDKTISFIQEIENKLQSEYQDPALCRQYAWWLLEELTRQQKEELITQDIIQLTDQQETTLADWLDDLITKKMPLQYLIGAAPFNNLELLVEPPILIPRPETEEWTIRLIKRLNQLENKNFTILDIGTGSGCIALALANAFPKATVWATDISESAIELAQKNALHNGITNVHFVTGNIFEGLPANTSFDLIVSNPPYIAPEEWKTLEKTVTLWEDKQALVAPHHGLAIIEAIIKQACQFIKPNKELEEKDLDNLIIEIGYTQGQAVSALMEKAGITSITIEKDLEGKDRVVSGRVEPCGQSHQSTTPS